MSGGGKKRKPKQGEGSTRDAFAYIPSAIHVDHRRNYSREVIGKPPPELRPYLGDHCCFTLAEIEARLASLKTHRQINAVSVYLTLTGDAYLVDGYLRHAAFLLAEVRGELDQIPGASGKILCTTITEPKSPADWLAIAERNYEENTQVKSLSPIDKARYATRLMSPLAEGGFDLDAEAASQRIGLTNKRQLDRYLRLLKLPPDVIASVHTGKTTMSAALSASTKSGQADSPGPRGNFSVRRMRKAIEMRDATPPPKTRLSSDEQVVLIRLIAGEVVDADQIPEPVREWAEWMQPEPAPREPKTPKKTAPPKPGEGK